jgi:transposase
MDWVACVGIDWGDKEHNYKLATVEGMKTGGRMKNTAEDLHQWAREIRQQFASGIIIVAVEQGQWSLISALMMYEYFVFVLINPRASKAYRDARRLSGASSDASDAGLICEFAIKHLDELRQWRPDDVITRKMRLLVEQRRTLVDQRTRTTHMLAATLKEFFPQALEWFGGESSPLLRGVLARWPTLEHFRQASVDEIAEVMRAHRRRKVAVASKALAEKVRAAILLTHDAAITTSCAMYAQALIAMIDPLDEQIAKYDQVIAECWATHPDRQLFDSLPGAGPVLAPRLAVAFGRDRSRYASAAEMACYSGIAPVIEQSGKQRWVHARWGFPTFLHQSFHEFAQASIPHSRWAKAIYHQQRERGAGHHQAIRDLAFRWIGILFRLWKNGDRYNEQTHLDHLRRTQSPIVQRLAA